MSLRDWLEAHEGEIAVILAALILALIRGHQP
jgi:hypothetical protein